MSRLFSIHRPTRRMEVFNAHLPLASLSAVALFVAFFVPPSRLPLPPCNFLRLTGFPCPFCGYTRAFHAVATGNWSQALVDCPLGAFTFAAVVAVFLWHSLAILFGIRLVRGRWLYLSGLRGMLLISTGTLLIVANWVYRIVQGFK